MSYRVDFFPGLLEGKFAAFVGELEDDVLAFTLKRVLSVSLFGLVDLKGSGSFEFVLFSRIDNLLKVALLSSFNDSCR